MTVGITPTFPATGYGYIQTKQDLESAITPVLRFKEKPDLATASQYLAEGDYFWNSGMFIWSAQTIIGAFERYLPEVASLFASIDRKYGTGEEQVAVNQAFNLSPSISIDYGIMEKRLRCTSVVWLIWVGVMWVHGARCIPYWKRCCCQCRFRG